MRHGRAYMAIGTLTGLAAAATAIWHFVWLEPYSVTAAELQDRHADKQQLTPGSGHCVDLRLQSFDGALVTGRIVYRHDPAQAARPFPVLIGMHAMGRSHMRWWQAEFSGRPTREQTHRLTQKQMIIDTVRDHRMLLDGLVTQRPLDPQRITAAGCSMGARGALLLAGLDDRERAVAAMVPPHLGDNVAAAAPINLVSGLQGKRVWLPTADADDHATPAQNQALFDAIPSQDEKHLRFESGHLLPTDHVEQLSDGFRV